MRPTVLGILLVGLVGSLIGLAWLLDLAKPKRPLAYENRALIISQAQPDPTDLGVRSSESKRPDATPIVLPNTGSGGASPLAYHDLVQEGSATPNGASSAAAQLDRRLRASAFDLIVERMALDESTEHIATDLAYFRSRVFGSEDDPDWARPMERKLFDYVLQLPDADTTQVSSIECRSWGCEMQLSHDYPSSAGTSIWVGLQVHFPSLAQAMNQTTLVDGKIVQVTYVRRPSSDELRGGTSRIREK